jgi:hypothetical protein
MADGVSLVLEPRAVSRKVAAAALSMSLSTFETDVQPQLKVIRMGSRVLVPVAELDRFVRERAAYTVEPRKAA